MPNSPLLVDPSPERKRDIERERTGRPETRNAEYDHRGHTIYFLQELNGSWWIVFVCVCVSTCKTFFHFSPSAFTSPNFSWQPSVLSGTERE